MKRYAVVFEESAQADVRRSYDWGCRVWGKKEAQPESRFSKLRCGSAAGCEAGLRPAVTLSGGSG